MDIEEAAMRKPLYIEMMENMAKDEVYVLDLDAQHLYHYSPTLYQQLIHFPSEVIPYFDNVVNMEYRKNFNPNFDLLIQVRPFNLRARHGKRMRELGPNDIDKLISMKGIVIRVSDIIPEMKEACFRCTSCGKEKREAVYKARIEEPSKCTNCLANNAFELVHNKCLFGDKQHVKLQENPENVPEGETPMTVHLCSFEDHVNFVKPGDRVDVIGVYRAQGVRVNPYNRTLRVVYRTYLDVVSFVKTDRKRFHVDVEDEA